MLLTDEQVSLLNNHVQDCNAQIKTISAKVLSQKRLDLFSDTREESAKVVALMVQISDAQTAAFYAIRNNNPNAIAA